MRGAFDPLDRIADVCEKHNVWMHVDVSGPQGDTFKTVDKLLLSLLKLKYIFSVLLCFRLPGGVVCCFPSSTDI